MTSIPVNPSLGETTESQLVAAIWKQTQAIDRLNDNLTAIVHDLTQTIANSAMFVGCCAIDSDQSAEAADTFAKKLIAVTRRDELPLRSK